MAKVGVALALSAAGCGETHPTTASPVHVSGTPQVRNSAALQVTLAGPSARDYLLSGVWTICDHGTVTNPGPATAHDVRVTVTYVDHGAVIGMVDRAQSAAAGGGIGDLGAGQSHEFRICGTAENEPDSDRVSAAPAP